MSQSTPTPVPGNSNNIIPFPRQSARVPVMPMQAGPEFNRGFDAGFEAGYALAIGLARTLSRTS